MLGLGRKHVDLGDKGHRFLADASVFFPVTRCGCVEVA